MELLYDIMPLVLYFLGAVLLFVVIILVTNLIATIDKTNVLLYDLEAKSQSLNGLFEAIDSVSQTISSANMRVVTTVTNIVSKLFRKKKKKKISKENDDYE